MPYTQSSQQRNSILFNMQVLINIPSKTYLVKNIYNKGVLVNYALLTVLRNRGNNI